MSKKGIKFLIGGAIISLMLVGCDGPFADYKNYDLKVEYQKCQVGNFSAAGEQRCSNVRKECEKRKEATGFRC